MLSQEWKDKTCKTCEFNIKSRCRKNPPVIGKIDDVVNTEYPYVNNHTPACSCWRVGVNDTSMDPFFRVGGILKENKNERKY